MAQIHQITDPGKGFGYLGEHNCMEPQPTWQEAFSVMVEKELEDIVATGYYNRSVADKVMELLKQHLETRSGEAAIRRFFYLLYEHQKYIVIAVSSRRNSPAQARAYTADCLQAVDRFRQTGEPVF